MTSHPEQAPQGQGFQSKESSDVNSFKSDSHKAAALFSAINESPYESSLPIVSRYLSVKKVTTD
jgi:hypothetical protein